MAKESKESKKNSELKCPVPKDFRDKINEVGDVVDKHKRVVDKFRIF